MGRTAGYEVLSLRIHREDEELAIAELWSQGTLGIELREEGEGPERVVLLAYFERDGHAARDWVTGKRGLAGRPVEVLSHEVLDERDWLEEHRRRTVPFALGGRFWIDAGEPGSGTRSEIRAGASGAPQGSLDSPGSAGSVTASAEVSAGRFRLRIPARRAFGTGSHETTRLVVDFLEAMPLEGKRLLDVGCGSGVLSLVASRLGAASVFAFEVDPVAAFLAVQNQILNQVPFPLFAGRVEALAEVANFDLAMVNVIPERIAPDLAGIARRLRPGAGAIFSGCLVERSESYGRTLEEIGFRTVETLDLGDWRAFLTLWDPR